MPTPGLWKLGAYTASSPCWALGMVDTSLENSGRGSPVYPQAYLPSTMSFKDKGVVSIL